VVIKAIISIQSWIFGMNYLDSYLKVTLQSNSKIILINKNLIWIVSSVYSLIILTLTILFSIYQTKKDKLFNEWHK